MGNHYFTFLEIHEQGVELTDCNNLINESMEEIKALEIESDELKNQIVTLTREKEELLQRLDEREEEVVVHTEQHLEGEAIIEEEVKEVVEEEEPEFKLSKFQSDEKDISKYVDEVFAHYNIKLEVSHVLKKLMLFYSLILVLSKINKTRSFSLLT